MSDEGPGPAAGDELGLEKHQVRLLPHNPRWVTDGERECATVRALLGAVALEVLHIGSTAVPGMDAKPILDIAVTVGDRVRIDEVVARLCAGGTYSYDGDRREDGGLLFVRGEGSFRTVHVHVVGVSSQAWKDYRRFHGLLINDAAARERYQSAKRELARRFPLDRERYTQAKGAVVEELLASEGRPPTTHAG